MPAGMKVSDCLRKYQTGGLRRRRNGLPFEDIIESERTPKEERQIAGHPSLKPQSFLRQLVHAALPLSTGIIADPFMGSASTIAAAEALGLTSVRAVRTVRRLLLLGLQGRDRAWPLGARPRIQQARTTSFLTFLAEPFAASWKTFQGSFTPHGGRSSFRSFS